MLRQTERSTIEVLAKRGESIRQIASELESYRDYMELASHNVDAPLGRTSVPKPAPSCRLGLHGSVGVSASGGAAMWRRSAPSFSRRLIPDALRAAIASVAGDMHRALIRTRLTVIR